MAGRERAPSDRRRTSAASRAGGEIVRTLNSVWARYRRKLRRCQRQLSAEALHDLRVQTRRLLTCLDLLAPIAGAPAKCAAARKTLHKRLSALGPLRDAHVQRVDLDARLEKYPELAPLHRHVRRREHRLSQSVGKELRKTGISRLAHRMGVFRRGLVAGLKDASAIARLRAKYAESMRAGLAAVDALREHDFRDLAKVHAARILLKHLRYGAEVLPASVRGVTRAQLLRLRKCVGALGRIHDIDVQLKRIARHEKKGDVASGCTASYRAELARRREKLAAKCTNRTLAADSRVDKPT